VPLCRFLPDGCQFSRRHFVEIGYDKAHATDRLKFVAVARYQIPVEEVEGTGIFAAPCDRICTPDNNCSFYRKKPENPVTLVQG